MVGFSSAARSPFGDAILTLRPWETGDDAAVMEALADPEIRRWTPLPQPASLAEAREWIESRLARDASDQQKHFAIIESASGQIAGGINVFFHDRLRAEIGYFTGVRLRRRGLASGAVRLTAGWAHSNGVERLEALIEVANVASFAVVERAGFRREGLLRGYRALRGVSRDMYIYGRLASDPVADVR